MKTAKGTLIILIGAALLAVASDSCTRYWTLHARLSLALGGCSFCRIESDGDVARLPVRPPEPVAALIYRKANYAGYLNRYGIFISFSEGQEMSGLPKAFETDVKTIAVLFYLKVLSAAIFVILLPYLIFRIIRRTPS